MSRGHYQEYIKVEERSFDENSQPPLTLFETLVELFFKYCMVIHKSNQMPKQSS